jgi:hypothetical protein
MSLALALPTWDDLRDHVQRVLSGRDRIDLCQSSLIGSIIYRSGRPCGVMFQLRGPRLMQTHAIWPADEDRLLYYDSRGVRFAEEQLAESPEVTDAMANRRLALSGMSDPLSGISHHL